MVESDVLNWIVSFVCLMTTIFSWKKLMKDRNMKGYMHIILVIYLTGVCIVYILPALSLSTCFPSHCIGCKLQRVVAKVLERRDRFQEGSPHLAFFFIKTGAVSPSSPTRPPLLPTWGKNIDWEPFLVPWGRKSRGKEERKGWHGMASLSPSLSLFSSQLCAKFR